ncbi:MAG: hypothetical protein EBR09_05475 [Proteobacteria bacterium]|nr:hypothetical protein [Pseudomonadota bacterium]
MTPAQNTAAEDTLFESAYGSHRRDWDPDAYAAQLTLEDCVYLPVFEFSAAAEYSTQSAFESMQKGFSEELERRQPQDNPERNFIRILNYRLQSWVKEEERHVRYFSTAFDRLSSAQLAGPAHGMQTGRHEIKRFGIESPIPESQHWHTTIFFLLFSEITSMLWYRKFYRHAQTPALRNALSAIHGDETAHYRFFLDACCRLTAIRPHLVREARKVFSAFLFMQRELKSSGLPAEKAGQNSEAAKTMNWWEHSAFESFVSTQERRQLMNQVIALQKFSLNRISAAANGEKK